MIDWNSTAVSTRKEVPVEVIIRATPGVTTFHLGRKGSICGDVGFERDEDQRMSIDNARLDGRRLCRKCARLLTEWVSGLAQ